MNSSLKYLIDEMTGLIAPSPNGQNARPRMLSQMSSNLSRSASLPSPRSSECSNWTIQYADGLEIQRYVEVLMGEDRG